MGADRERVRGAALFVCFYPRSVLSPMEPEINAPKKGGKRKTIERPDALPELRGVRSPEGGGGKTEHLA